MSRSSSGTVMGVAGTRPLRSQGRKPRLAVQDKTGPAKVAKAARAKVGTAKTGSAKPGPVKSDSKPSLQSEWEEVSDEQDELPEIYNMLDKPAPGRDCDSAVRRRIEMLREERQLQQALSEVFDF